MDNVRFEEVGALQILEANETAFLDRYGDSLKNEFEKLSTDEKLSGYGTVLKILRSNNHISTKKDSLLFVSIGFVGTAEANRVFDKNDSYLRYIVWEPDLTVFLIRCCLEDISESIRDERFTFLLKEDEEKWAECFDTVIKEYNYQHLQYFCVNGYEGYMDASDLFSSKLKKCIYDRNTVANFGWNFKSEPYRNTLFAVANISKNYNIEHLFDAITDKSIPIVLVAAGPSLDLNARFLKVVKGKALVFAVSHSVKKLDKEGIHPDFVAVSDASSGCGFLDGLSYKGFYVISSVSAAGDVQREFNGKLIYHSFDFSIVPLEATGLVDKWYSASTGSVATDVFYLLVNAGFRDFILVGQDLAYGKKGNTHANGERHEFGGNDFQYSEVPGIDGKPVLSRVDWVFFRDNFESLIEKTPDLNVIDATEGGALIKGTQIMTLKEAIEKKLDKDYPIDEWMRNFEQCKKADQNEADAWLRQVEMHSEKTFEDIKRAVAVNKLIQNEWKAGRVSGDYSKSLCEEYDVLYNRILDDDENELIRRYCIFEIQLYNEQAITFERDQDIFKKLEIERILFESMVEKCRELREYVKELLDK
ncbi:MAG: motility associated factor glycosyltransferase family protein [Lachnospiraceae bacterium]|nr:motility associated factor glycosyltransferase family protein [Lachnospiraceae bacterium]